MLTLVLQAPQYVLEPDPQSTDNSTCMIRFIVSQRSMWEIQQKAQHCSLSAVACCAEF
jgi:hypothetical protein